MFLRRSANITLVVLLLGSGAGIATAAASSATLTSAEYYQLTAARDRLKSVNIKTPQGLNTAVLDCEEIQEQTQLLTEERADCAAQLRMSGFTAAMAAAGARCAAFKTVAARLNCLLPVYRRLYAQTAIFYHAESKIRQIAAARGLPGRCTNVLADPQRVVSLERRMLHAIGVIISTVKAGRLYPFEEASGKALTVIAEVAAGQQANKGQLSLCPHR